MVRGGRSWGSEKKAGPYTEKSPDLLLHLPMLSICDLAGGNAY